jgi:hypothetical protein
MKLVSHATVAVAERLALISVAHLLVVGSRYPEDFHRRTSRFPDNGNAKTEI